MTDLINVYCDESCHLEHDQQRAMVLGAVWCPADRVREVSDRLREIKARHNLDTTFETKWTKVSPSKVAFYRDVIDYFFDDHHLHFRALIVPDKPILDHARHAHTHDEWYYKMYFDMLKVIIDPGCRYQIYLDIKDSRGGAKVRKLHEVLANSQYDFAREIIEHIQVVRSHESELLPLADLLIGTVGYVNRGLTGNTAKTALVERLRQRSGKQLTQTTLLREDKLNLFRWKPREASP